LIAAAILHLAMTSAVYLVGRKRLMPGTFDTTGAATAFAQDAADHLEDATTLTRIIWSARFREWFTAAYPFHVKAYSVSFAIIGGVLGFNILSAEPLNLLCYLGIVILIYKLGSEVFDSRTGLVAAVVVGLWPSFVLHTTQLLKDPMFVLGILALVFVMMRFLTRNYSWRIALMSGVVGAAIAIALWKLSSDMVEVLLATMALGGIIMLVRQFQLRKVLVSNCLGLALLIALTVTATFWVPVHRYSDNPRVQALAIQGRRVSTDTPKPILRWWQFPAKIGNVRQRFATEHASAKSNIDTDVRLTTYGDLVRYLPRAVAIGLFAPFPNMWFSTGSAVGSAGRMLSGVETLLMYLVVVLAMVGLWNGRRRASVWLLFSVALVGTTALGLAVLNVGTLYRLRYAFLMLLMVAAAGEATSLFYRVAKRQPSPERPGP
jgi:4-amino-4-deoxy-L-arabinose transferase-like glycosyltransferase